MEQGIYLIVQFSFPRPYQFGAMEDARDIIREEVIFA